MIDNQPAVANLPQFHALKIIKKKLLTKHSFEIELEIPDLLKKEFRFVSGQYLTLKYIAKNSEVINDYSITSAPFENRLTLGIKISNQQSNTQQLFDNYNVGDTILSTKPNGRFYFPIKPNEKRTIVAFAGGIGITPIISHIKTILENENTTRIFLFYSNKTREDIIYHNELETLKLEYSQRLNTFYFFTQEKIDDLLFYGRIDAKKINLIINQILHLDDDDDESTIWDSTDKVIICGPGEMIKNVANACYDNGILKKNIHFELFQSFNEDIYPQEKAFPLIEDISVSYKFNHLHYKDIIVKNNKRKILHQLLDMGYNVPYSCKSGVCGSCICKLKLGEVEMEENEYLTDNEVLDGKILPCVATVMSKTLLLDFDNV